MFWFDFFFVSCIPTNLKHAAERINRNGGSIEMTKYVELNKNQKVANLLEKKYPNIKVSTWEIDSYGDTTAEGMFLIYELYHFKITSKTN